VRHLILAICILVSSSAFSKTQVCQWKYYKQGSKLSWTAFKTPKKVGVGASFDDFTINAKPGTSLSDLLMGSTFVANSQSVNSGDKARDAKIQTFFFKKMLEGTKITGKVLKASESEIEVEMTFNGKTKKVKLIPSYEEKAMRLTLKGQINVLDFGMEKNLARLTKACFEKHEGKTWPEVDLNLAAHVMKDCK
jgi:hypothetical protein